MAGQLPTLMGGVMQGYGFMDQVKTNEANRDQAKITAGQNTEIYNRRIAADDRAIADRTDKDFINAAKSMQYSNDNKQAYDPKAVSIVQKHTGVNFSEIGSTKMDQALKRAEAILNPETGDQLRTPEGMETFNYLFKKGISRMDGTKDKEGNTRLETVATDLIPGVKDGVAGYYADLNVTWQKPDGSTFQKDAPMTGNRDSDPVMDPGLLFMPATSLIDRVKGISMMHQDAKKNEGVRSIMLGSAMRTAGYTPPKKSYGMSGNVIYDKNSGEYNTVSGFQSGKGGGLKETLVNVPGMGQQKLSTMAGIYAKENGLESDNVNFQTIQESPTFKAWLHELGVQTGNEGEAVNPRNKAPKYNERSAKKRADKIVNAIDLDGADMFATDNEEKAALGNYTKESLRKELTRRYIAGEDASDLEAIANGDAAAPANSTQQNNTVNQLPSAAVNSLKEGIATTFKNGQTWTLIDGQPKRTK
ncbi:MAG: hypothetical protein OEX07_07660 [Gammaproteobacteria bacterium]|nr:hypothetical protein [Gammaproteobacteria bacterium]